MGAKGGAPRFSQEWLEQFEARKKGGRKPAAGAPAAPPAPSKYGNAKVAAGEDKYDSRKEMRRHLELLLMQRGGQLAELRRQVPFELAPAVRLAGEARKKPALRYFADFTYMRGGQLVVEDTKSDGTRKLEAFRIKKHLMKTVHNIDITEV